SSAAQAAQRSRCAWPGWPQSRQRVGRSSRPAVSSQRRRRPDQPPDGRAEVTVCGNPKLTHCGRALRLAGLCQMAVPMSAETNSGPEPGRLRHDWRREEIEALFDLPFNELLFRAQTVHRRHFKANEVQVSTLLSVKTGGCPEDCAYCPQAQRYQTGVDAQKLMSTEAVLEKARAAKAAGASRFCMGAAWRSPKDRDIPKVAAMIREVKALGMETCATLGMLSGDQARALRDA